MSRCLTHRSCLSLMLLFSVPALASQDAGSGPAVTAASETKMILNRPLARDEHAALSNALQMADDLRTGFGATRTAWEELPDYLPFSPLRNVSEQEVAAAIQARKTFFLESWSDDITVKADLSLIPNYPLLEAQVKWEELRDEQGRPVPLQPREDSRALVSLTSASVDESGVWKSKLPLAGGVKPPDRLDGWKGAATVTFRVPVQFRIVSFKPSDVGVTREDVTVVEWKHGQVVLEDKKGRLGLRDAEVAGISANGLLLDSSGSVENSTELELLRKVAQTRWEDLPAVIPPPAERRVRLTRAFRGAPSRVDIYFIERWSTHTVRPQLLPAPASTFTSTYLSDVGRAPCEVTAQTLKKQVRIFASRASSDVSDDFGEPRVVLQLPPCVNSAWSQAKFEGLKYLSGVGAGRPLAPAKTTSQYHAGAFAWVLRIAPPEGPAGKEPDGAFSALAQVKGKAHLVFPRLRALSFSRARPEVEQAMLTQEDRTIMLRLPRALSDKLPVQDEREWVGWFAEEPRNPLVGYDAAGRRLRPLQLARQSEEDGSTVLTASFAEPPERVDLHLLSEEVRVTLPFAVKLPPAPPPEDG